MSLSTQLQCRSLPRVVVDVTAGNLQHVTAGKTRRYVSSCRSDGSKLFFCRIEPVCRYVSKVPGNPNGRWVRTMDVNGK